MKIIAVDTGNRYVKTPNFHFTAGLAELGQTEPILKVDNIKYKGNFYALTETRTGYIKDKTKNNNYYILSLFGIAKELELAEPERKNFDEDINLVIGLPPSHISLLKEKFKEYFMQDEGNVSFVYNEKHFNIVIKDIQVLPQGYPAALKYVGKYKDYPTSYIIDIGGYTTDVFVLNKGMPDLNLCESVDMGVIQMCNEVKTAVNREIGAEIGDIEIEETLRGNNSLPPAFRKKIVEIASRYVSELANKLYEKKINFKLFPAVFVGGGSGLFENFLKEEASSESAFETDVSANAKGYAIFGEKIYGNKKKK